MKITTNVLTTTDKQGLTAKRAQNARKNISAQVVLDAGDAAESHITLTDVKDENGNVVSQKIAVDGDVGGAKYEAGSDYVDVNNEAHTIDLSDSTKEALGKISPSYDEGNGIKIENNTISVDTTVVATKDDLSSKVDKVENKQLSAEDYTTADKTKLEGIEQNAQVNKIESIKVGGNTISPTEKVVDIPVDMKYSGTSVNPQSGMAVAEAIAEVSIELSADMTGATVTTAGKHGRVPAPPVAGNDPKVLTDDAVWTNMHEITVAEADKLLGWKHVDWNIGADTEEGSKNG